jgi:hypothetical protein
MRAKLRFEGGGAGPALGLGSRSVSSHPPPSPATELPLQGASPKLTLGTRGKRELVSKVRTGRTALRSSSVSSARHPAAQQSCRLQSASPKPHFGNEGQNGLPVFTRQAAAKSSPAPLPSASGRKVCGSTPGVIMEITSTPSCSKRAAHVVARPPWEGKDATGPAARAAMAARLPSAGDLFPTSFPNWGFGNATYAGETPF